MPRAARSRDEWRAEVEEFERSGLSVAEFAAERGLSPRTLAWWRWRLRREDESPPIVPEPVFVPVSVDVSEVEAHEAPSGVGFALEAVLPNGVRLRVEGGDEVGAVIAALGAV